MKVLVTGGCGFIGSHFIKRLLREYSDYIILNVDALTYAGNIENLREVKNNLNYKFVEFNIAHDGIEHIIQEFSPNMIVNFAAESIAADEYIPIKSTLGTKVVSFSTLWKQQSKYKQVYSTEKGQAIFFDNNNVKVLSFFNGGQWMPIKAITRHRYSGDIVKLNQKWGNIKITPNHSLYSANLDKVTPLSNPELLVVRNVNESKKKYINKNKKLLTVLAAYITEGSAFKNKTNGSYTISISQKDHEWLDNIGKCMKEVFNINKYDIKDRGGGLYELIVCNKNLYTYLINQCGRCCDNKKFPNWVFDMDNIHRKLFVAMLQEGDGCIKEYTKRSHNNYVTTSRYLANQICLLLSLIGQKFTVYETERKEAKICYTISMKDSFHIGLCTKQMKIIKYTGWVYDIEVEKTHNFVCGMGNVVCHNTHVDRSIKDPKAFLETDTLGLFNMIYWSLKCDVEKFIHISTDEVYGTIQNGEVDETHSLNPSSPYSASKASSDLLINSFIKTYRLPAIIVRPCNNYGPNQYMEKLVPTTIGRLLNGKRALLHGTGREIREWIYVEDCCRAIDMVLHKGKIGEIYNIGTGFRLTNLIVIQNIIQNIYKTITYEDFIEVVKNRPGNDTRYAIDSTKILNDVGDYKLLKFKEGLNFTIQWYKTNKWFWEGTNLEANRYDEDYLR